MKGTKLRRLPLVLGIAMAMVVSAAWTTSAGPAGASATFHPELEAEPTITAPMVTADEAAPYTVTAAAKAKAKKAAKKAKAKKAAKAKAKAKKAAKAKAKKSGKKKSVSKQARAQKLLRAKIRQYPILKGSTVTFGDAHGYQAVAYYHSGRIVISKKHKASLERIINHEVWHIIDWRDNGRIDWGESVPPKNASSYRD